MTDKSWRFFSLALGVLGLIVSWVFFTIFFKEYGLDLSHFWTNALWTGDGAGLTWDLVFSGGIVSLLAIRDRKTLGGKGLIGILLTTLILGVCGGLGLYVFLVRPDSQPIPGTP